MKDNIVFFNIGWMERYQGITKNDKIIGGGSYVDEKNFGWEIYNFKPFNKFLYGYVQPPHIGDNINISKLGAGESAASVDDMLVIWTAKEPRRGGVFVVGWYEHAIVYRSYHEPPKGSKRKYNGEKLGYYSKASVENGYLLKPIYRDTQIPIGRNGKGQANLWYAEGNLAFRKEIINYIVEAKKHKGDFVSLLS